MAAIGRCQQKVGINLNLSNFYRDCLVLADIDRDVMTTLQLHLQEPDHSIVLELLTDRPYQYRTHVTSRRRISPNAPDENDEVARFAKLYTGWGRRSNSALTPISFTMRMMQ
jgi:hypothetical protein